MAKHEYLDDGPLPASTAVGHETTDAEAAPILRFLAVLAAVTVGAAVVIVLFYNYLERREAAEKTARYPLAAGQRRPLPPPPRLQTYPFDDIKELRRSEAPRLERYEWVDKKTGVVRIPIERAIDLVAERGLPYRKEIPAAERESNAPGSPDASSEQTPQKGGGR